VDLHRGDPSAVTLRGMSIDHDLSPVQAAEDEDLPMGPNFICIGAQKAGTHWLYDQAASHPDIWMPPIKELRFLGGRWPLAREEALRRFNVQLRALWKRGEVDPRNLEFLRRVVFETADADAGDLDAYRRLFDVAGRRISGDISPQYAILGRRRLPRLLEEFPHTRFVYVVREPVSRVWSQVCMQYNWSVTPAPRLASRIGTVPSDVVTNPDTLAAYIRIPGVVNHSFQGRVIDRWHELAGDRFAAFLMDDMIAVPEVFRRRVFDHIGLDGDRCTIPADHNKKIGRQRHELTPELRQVIVDYLDDEPDRLRRQVDDGWITRMPENQAVSWL